MQALHDWHGQASGVERAEGLPGASRDTRRRRAMQTRSTGFGLGVEHLDEDRHGLLMSGLLSGGTISSVAIVTPQVVESVVKRSVAAGALGASAISAGCRRTLMPVGSL